MATEAGAIKRLQDIALQAAKAMGSTIPGAPPPMHVMLVSTRERIPRGERFQLIPGIKSPRGELMNVKENGDRYDCLGRFPAMDVLAFCMAKLDELGAPCPVTVLGPDGVAFDPQSNVSTDATGGKENA